MDERPVLVEKSDGLAWITLNRPAKRNALSEQMAHGLIAALAGADGDDEVRAVVLTGSGEAFCAGGDIGEFAAAQTRGAPTLYREGLATTELFRMGPRLRKPLVGAINGAALGGGCGLAAMCHLGIASERATFGTPEIALGLFPLVVLPHIIRSVGPRRALEMALSGRVLTAQEAQAAGLVNRVVPHDALRDQAEAAGRSLTARSPAALRIGLDAFQHALDLDFDRALDYLTGLRVIATLSEDLKEGTAAFLEKRQPRWTGR